MHMFVAFVVSAVNTSTVGDSSYDTFEADAMAPIWRPFETGDRLHLPCTPSTRLKVCGPQLICARWHSPTYRCEECRYDDECASLAPEQVCIKEFDNPHTICAHKSLLDPGIDPRDTWGLALAFFACAIAAGGGIGGGGLLLPVLILVFSFTPHEATPLSNVTILGGAIANFMFNGRRMHPSDRKRLISYEVALMMEPMTIFGALLGCLLNKMLPTWLITTLLVLLLGVTTDRTLKRGMKGWKRETRQKTTSAAGAALLTAEPTYTHAVRMDHGSAYHPPSELLEKREAPPSWGGVALMGGVAIVQPASSEEGATELAAMIAREKRIPGVDVGLLICALVGSSVLSLLRGRSKKESLLHVVCGSSSYWLLNLAQLLFLLTVSLYIRFLLMRRHTRRLAIGYPFGPDDVLWDTRKALAYPLICALAGLCAGMFGIGGGIIKGPLMLEMGLSPDVSSATSAYMILFTTAAASIQYALFGALRAHYASALFLTGLIGTVCGQYVVRALIKRSGRESLIVILIAVVIGVSTLLMGSIGAYTFVQELSAGQDQGLRNVCDSEPPDR